MSSLPSRLVACLAGAIAIGAFLGACGGGDQPAPASLDDALSGKQPSAPELRQLKDEANEILEGGTDTFEARLAELRGHPVVVNQWASWCGPCRFEFPYFQRLAARYGDRVAFLGVDSQDAREDAERFLAEFPTPYPHYFDPDAEIARLFKGGRAWPTTAFYDAVGELTNTHLGAYADEGQLEADIREYALGD